MPDAQLLLSTLMEAEIKDAIALGGVELAPDNKATLPEVEPPQVTFMTSAD